MGAALLVRSELVERDALRDSVVARWLTLLIALGFASGGLAGIIDLARDPHETFDSARRAYVLFGAMVVGSLLYATGTILWTGARPFALRAIGAVLIAALLTVSWVFVLAFPLAAILFVTLAELPGDRTARAHPRLRRT